MIEALSTARLDLEPLRIEHAPALAVALGDRELYRYLPGEPLDLAQWRERLQRWADGRSPDGEEHWLNWIALERASGEGIGHFQVTLGSDGTALLGYIVGKPWQGRGLASEALRAIFEWLGRQAEVKIIRACIDTRNARSIALVEKLGLRRVAEIPAADFFKGERSDEWVYELSRNHQACPSQPPVS